MQREDGSMVIYATENFVINFRLLNSLNTGVCIMIDAQLRMRSSSSLINSFKLFLSAFIHMVFAFIHMVSV